MKKVSKVGRDDRSLDFVFDALNGNLIWYGKFENKASCVFYWRIKVIEQPKAVVTPFFIRTGYLSYCDS